MKEKLTNSFVAKLGARAAAYDVVDTEQRGLTLRVNTSGVKVFYSRFRVNGKLSRYRIGSAEALTVAQARDKHREVMAEVYSGLDPSAAKREHLAARNLLLGEFIGQVYAPRWLSRRKSGDATLARLKCCFEAEFWDLPLVELKTGRVEEWRAGRLAAGRATTTVNRDITALKAVLSKAVEWDYLERHPLERLRPEREDRAKKVRFLSEVEERRLFVALGKREERLRAERDSANVWRADRGYALLPDLRHRAFADHLKPMVLLSLRTGLRRGELFSLRWENIDFDLQQLTIEGDDAKSGKTRHVPLDPETLGALKAWREQTDMIGLVFSSVDGKPFDNVNTAWAGVLQDAKIREFRWHDMRHTYASWLVMTGAHLNTVRELLGHADIKTTLRYSHLCPDVKREAVIAMATRSRNIVSLDERKAAKRKGKSE